MAILRELIRYCDDLLEIGVYQDHCPNGLQVEGRDEIATMVTGVTASQALIDAAVARSAELLLVHHGLFWSGDPVPITGIKRGRIKALMEHEISLLAYHLPLDGHATLGNNAQLGRVWGVEISGNFGLGPNGGLGCYSTLSRHMPVEELARLISIPLHREPLIISGGDHVCHRFGWCSGAAQGYIESAAALGLDAFISGEVSEHTAHLARELGIHYIAVGHHASERYGVRALGEHLASRFSLNCEFIDIDNPV